MQSSARKGFVVSDLHIFAARSEIHKYLERIENAARYCEFVVFNGDIFDFEWSQFQNVEKTVEEAVSLLTGLVKGNPSCRFYYVFGNHDSHQLFFEAIKRINLPNFEFSLTHVLVGKSLFIHGDLVLEGDIFNRHKLENFTRTRSKFMSHVYHGALKMRVHKFADIVYRPQRMARMIYNALNRNGFFAKNDVTDVYFGHTHVPFNDFVYLGVRFHNTGSTVMNFKNNFIEIK